MFLSLHTAWTSLVFLYGATGTLYTGFNIGREFSYLGKFCFDYNTNISQVVGTIQGQIHTPMDGLKLAIYDDEALFWNYIMDNSLCDCECKIAPQHTKHVYDIKRTADNEESFSFDFKIREHLRPRFWYCILKFDFRLASFG